MRRQQRQIPRLAVIRQEGAFYSTLLRLANSYGVKREGWASYRYPLTNQELAELLPPSRESLKSHAE